MNNFFYLVHTSILGSIFYTFARCIYYNFISGKIKITKILFNYGTILGSLYGLYNLFYIY